MRISPLLRIAESTFCEKAGKEIKTIKTLMAKYFDTILMFNFWFNYGWSLK